MKTEMHKENPQDDRGRVKEFQGLSTRREGKKHGTGSLLEPLGRAWCHRPDFRL